MTDTPTDPETPETAPEATESPNLEPEGQHGAPDTAEAPTADPSPDTPDEPAGTPHREAARYRHRAREAEAALATATDALATARRAHIETILTNNHKITPAAFWLYFGDRDVNELTTADGTLDLEAITTTVHGAVTALGLNRQLPPDPSQGLGTAPPTPPPAPSWSQALRPPRSDNRSSFSRPPTPAPEPLDTEVPGW